MQKKAMIKWSEFYINSNKNSEQKGELHNNAKTK